MRSSGGRWVGYRGLYFDLQVFATGMNSARDVAFQLRKVTAYSTRLQ